MWSLTNFRRTRFFPQGVFETAKKDGQSKKNFRPEKFFFPQGVFETAKKVDQAKKNFRPEKFFFPQGDFETAKKDGLVHFHWWGEKCVHRLCLRNSRSLSPGLARKGKNRLHCYRSGSSAGCPRDAKFGVWAPDTCLGLCSKFGLWVTSV